MTLKITTFETLIHRIIGYNIIFASFYDEEF